MPVRSKLPDVEIPSVNVLDFIFDDPSNITDKPVWIDADDNAKSVSLRQALTWVRRIGLGLQRLGLRSGDVVMMCSTNHVLVPVLYLGVVGSTCAFTGTNPAYTPKEIAYQISNSQAKLILAHPSKIDDVLAAADEAHFPHDRIFHFSDDASGRDPTVRGGLRDWTSLLPSEAESASWRWPRLAGSAARTQLATINYSSGTTGLPKGVCGAHRNLVANVQQLIGLRHPDGLTPDLEADVWLAFLPLYHAYGQMYTILMAARRRVTVYVMPVFSFERYLQCVQRYRPSTLQVVPPVVVMLSKRPEVKKYDLSSVTDISCGAAPLKADLQNEVADRMGTNIVQGWGMTELTCAASGMPLGGVDREASCGLLLPNCEAKFLDEDGNEVGAGEPGELFVRGPNVMLGYWRNDKATKETLDADGWLRTGDVAMYNEDGKLWIVDRKKELIKVNGLQVAPAELESLLLENEHVADAAVVGIELDHEEYPRAYVQIQDVSKGRVQPRDIQDWLAPRVAKHKRLAGGVSFVDAVPKLASGKIVRKLLREWSKRDAEVLQKAGWTRSNI
ncbi:4-coumarate-CoA ligase 2 [Cordyceps fumosorosea ARSEF 2679]|uniref:4-coumarate-CoA ligase 2 n=1 Tax=Cordyceps fumosorosea (strain ARSEF 2679) TaxID=1081104 RepID=A0A168E5V8_CORFA|nr:4-coumarate-CoA ligase 2 [Cordyceps fumosorosea ARSEF 2679]OAA73415.1 4-coumarate-CoA ligase 2 [Cordyceps fumosorosea ARSEF 2679]